MQLITCPECDQQLAKLKTKTGDVHKVSTKKVEGQVITEVSEDPNFNLDWSTPESPETITCGCGNAVNIY